jgi:predicted flap endonuclease-1-like 5' DNA nuclease
MWNCTFGGLLWLILPFLIGIVTGWWAWAPKPVVQTHAEPRHEFGEAEVPAAPEPMGFMETAEVSPGATGEAELKTEQVVEPEIDPLIAPVSPLKASPDLPAGDIAETLDAAPAPKMASDYVTKIGIPAAVGPADDLVQVKGIGPKLNAVLNDIGVFRFDQIAAWTDEEIERVDNHLGAFRGRIVRDAWVEQADLLSKGLIGEFEVRFGKLDS